ERGDDLDDEEHGVLRLWLVIAGLHVFWIVPQMSTTIIRRIQKKPARIMAATISSSRRPIGSVKSIPTSSGAIQARMAMMIGGKAAIMLACMRGWAVMASSLPSSR